jgi:hypothetical protein
LKPKLVELQTEAQQLREKVRGLSDKSDTELKRMSETWRESPNEQIKRLQKLYVIYAYVTRWAVQLDEVIFQLSVH